MQFCHCRFMALQHRLEITSDKTEFPPSDTTGLHMAFASMSCQHVVQPKQQPNLKDPSRYQNTSSWKQFQKHRDWKGEKHFLPEEVSKEFQEPCRSYSNPGPLEIIFLSLTEFGLLKTSMHWKSFLMFLVSNYPSPQGFPLARQLREMVHSIFFRSTEKIPLEYRKRYLNSYLSKTRIFSTRYLPHRKKSWP